MPGIKGVEKIEIRAGETRAEEIKEVDRQVDPFLHAAITENPSGTTFYEKAKSDGLKDFLAIGEKEAFPALNEATSKSSEAALPPAETERSFFVGLSHFFKKTFPDFFNSLPIAPVGPMMIFSFLLTRRSEKAPSPEEYGKILEHFNDLLRNYDEALRRKRLEIPLSPEHQGLMNHLTTLEIARRRQEFVRENFAYHSLVSADRPNHPLYMGLQSHLDPSLPGPVFRFGPNEVFPDASSLIRFSEWFLEKTYRGEAKPGDKNYVVLRASDNTGIGVHVEFLENSAGETGSSEPGGRVVLHFTFERPIGLDGIGDLKPGNAVSYGTGGSLTATVPVMEGLKTPTQEMYVIGGPRGEPIGSFDLVDVFPGRFRPGLNSHSSFWREHALLSGREAVSRNRKP